MNAAHHTRFISPADAEATLNIYRPFVQHTAVSFEYEVPALDEWERRISEYTADFPWLVCQSGNEVVGYAYAGRHRARTAYAWSSESTIYLSDGVHGSGVATVLYGTLFQLLRLQGYINVFPGITAPNPRSERFHRKMGFEEIGIYKKVGYKLGGWHDVRWLQLVLAGHLVDPARPVSFQELHDHPTIAGILQGANEKLAGT